MMFKRLAPVKLPGAKSSAQQLWEQVHWGSRLMTTPTDYRTHRMFMKGFTRSDARRFLSGTLAKSVIWPLNHDVELLENKLRYEQHFSALGLPVPKTVAVISASDRPFADFTNVRSPDNARGLLSDLLHAGSQLVIKPLDAWEGDGVNVLVGIDDDDFILSNGSTRPAEEILANTRQGVWLVQERIPQHPAIARLNASTLNTLRLGTYRHRTGEVEVVFSVLRVGRSYSQVDGYNRGGYTVRVDSSSGRLMSDAHQKSLFSNEISSRHADSQVVFGEVAFPFWKETLELAEKFAGAAGDNKFVGWDVAASEQGPIFVEGNHNWDVQLAQIGSRGLLTDSFVETLRSDSGIALDMQKLPPLRPFFAIEELGRASRIRPLTADNRRDAV